MTKHTNSVTPYQVAEETFVIPELHLQPGAPAVYITDTSESNFRQGQFG